MKSALVSSHPLNSAINSEYTGIQSTKKAVEFDDLVYNRDEARRRDTTIMKKVPFFDLRSTDIDGFKCLFVDCKDTEDLQFFIEPLIPELQNQLKKMFTNLNSYADGYLSKFYNPAKAIRKACLIKCDSGYKRGEITETERRTANVYLIDENKTITHPLYELFQMDMQSKKCPRRIISVKFHRIGLHRTYNMHDVGQFLKKKYDGVKLNAIIKGYCENDCPLVELYEDNGNCIYQELIDRNILYKIQ
jgi:Tudor domain